MPVTYQENAVVVEGTCSLEDVEKLLEWFEVHPKGTLNLKQCKHFHSAILQVFMIIRPEITELPDDPYLRDWVVPAMTTTN